MPAFVIVDVLVKDPSRYEEYKDAAAASVALYGGKYIARGGKTEVLEGDWVPNRLVILEFESTERARQWLNSSEYDPARKLRHTIATSNMVLIEGL